MKNDVFTNGLWGGLIASLVMSGMAFYMKLNPENEPNPIFIFPFMLIAFYFVVRAIQHERNFNNNQITFGKAFWVGFQVTLVISALYVLTWLIIYYNFMPNFMEFYSEMVLKNTRPEDLTKVTEEMRQMKEWYKSPVMIILLTLLEILPLGIVVSFLSALVLKKNTSHNS